MNMTPLHVLFSRDELLATAKNAVECGVNNRLIECIALAQITLLGEVTEAETLALVGLTVKPVTANKVQYEKFKYANKLVKAASEVTLTTDDFKARLLALDTLDQNEVNKFQVDMALTGNYFNNAAGFKALIQAMKTPEAKTADAEKAAQKAAEKAAAKVGENSPADAEKDALATAAIAELIALSGPVGQLMAQLSGQALTEREKLVKLAEAWQADRATLLAKITKLETDNDQLLAQIPTPAPAPAKPASDFAAKLADAVATGAARDDAAKSEALRQARKGKRGQQVAA